MQGIVDLDDCRITIVLNALHGGGAEHVGRTWAAEIQRQGRRCRLIVLERPTEAQVKLAGLSLPVECIDRRSGWRSWLRLRRELSRAEADVVVSLQMLPNLATLLLRGTLPRGRRAVLAVSERNILSIPAERSTLRRRAKLALARRLYGRADRMIAISHPVAAEMISSFGVAADRCVVVPNPAAVKAADALARPRLASRDRVALVLAGRVSSQKRPWLAIDVAVALKSAGVTAEVCVFGEGPLLPELVLAAQAAGVGLDCRGWVETWPEECPEGAVLLLASIKEGFGNVLVEAACHGIPSVAVSGALGVADAMVPGITGVLSLSASPTALAKAVQSAQGCTFAGAENWLERFTPAQSTAQLLEVLSDALGERTP